MNNRIKKTLIKRLNKDYKQYLENTKDIKQIRKNNKKIFDKIRLKIQNSKELKSFYLYNY